MGDIITNNNNNYITESQRMICILEIYDIFIASTSFYNKEEKQHIILLLSNIWNIDYDLLYRYIYTRKPDYTSRDIEDYKNNITNCIQTIGRVIFHYSYSHHDSSNSNNVSNFAQTSYSLRYMEYIAQCIQMNEPLLLVGETGVGKTFLIQLLSQILSKQQKQENNLIVLNLSLQTDTTDLLGSFRPTSTTKIDTIV